MDCDAFAVRSSHRAGHLLLKARAECEIAHIGPRWIVEGERMGMATETKTTCLEKEKRQ